MWLCRKLEEVRGQLEQMLGVHLEGDEDESSVVLELLGLLASRLQELEEAAASERQLHQQVRSLCRASAVHTWSWEPAHFCIIGLKRHDVVRKHEQAMSLSVRD